MERVEIRPIRSREELEACFDLWAAVFPENRAFFQERLDHDPTYTEETTWIAKVNDVIAASVQIFPYYTSLDGSVLKVGGIGNVATLPDYRGRSLTQMILQRQSEWMVRKGFDLSLLFTGINPFYEKVGWETVPHSSYNLDAEKARNLVSAQRDLGQPYIIKPYDSLYFDQIKGIYDSFTKDYFGSALRTPEYWDGQLKWLKEKPHEFQVALENDQVVAYLRVKKGREGVLELTESCYKAGHASACLALVEDVLLKEAGCKSLRANVPQSHALYPFFAEAGAECSEETYAMWKILSLPLFFAKLTDVFSKRLQALSSEGLREIQSPLLIQSGGEEILLHLHSNNVSIEEPSDFLTYQGLYKRKPAELLSDFINGAPFNDPTSSILFPKRESLFWKTDSF